MSDPNAPVSVSSLMIKLVEGQARIENSMVDVKHDIKNFQMELGNYVPAKEIRLQWELHDQEHKAVTTRIEALEAKGKRWAAVIPSFIVSALVALVGIAAKYFFGVG